MRKLAWGLVAFAVAAVPWCSALSQTPPDPDLPGPLREVGFEQKLGDRIPLDLEFVDENGNAVPLGNYFGERPVVLALVYYECPMLCNLILHGVISSLRVLTFDPGDDFEVVVLSFDPDETAALATIKKREYMEQYERPGTEEGFHFLVGDQSSIDALTSAVGFTYVYDEEQDEFAHAAGITVLTPEGTIARYLFGIEYAPKDLRLALVEADQGMIGTFVDQLLLFCYNYDPAEGKYGAATMNLVRLGGGIVMAGIIGFILLSRRREKRLARQSTKEVQPS